MGQSSNNNNRIAQFVVLLMVLWMILALSFINTNYEAISKALPSGRASSNNSDAEFLRGTVSQNEIIDNLEKLGVKCVLHEGKTDLLIVDTVRLGTSAHYSGIKAGDIIKDFHKLRSNDFSLTIERNGKIYSSNLSAMSAQSEGNTLRIETEKDLLEGNINRERAAVSTSMINLPGIIQNNKISALAGKHDMEIDKTLLSYDIELIIDISGSMNFFDGTGDLTKFQWCHEQIRHLAQRFAPYNKTLIVTTFNTAYNKTKQCVPEKIEQIFATIKPEGGTDLLDPLMNRLNDAIKVSPSKDRPALVNNIIQRPVAKHRTLVVVITDGLPNVPSDPTVINRALIDFSQRLTSPGQVVITILQIGDTFEGRDFCLDLDDNLINEGAKYDIVDTKTFAELKEEGLVKAMMDAVAEVCNNKYYSKKYSLPQSSQIRLQADEDLKKQQDQRHAIEKQLLNR